MDTRVLMSATAIGTAGQVAMVLAGHYNRSVADLFAIGGMTISLLAGLLYAIWSREPALGGAVVGGLLAGGICAVIGIAVSYALGDVTASILALGTLSSAVTGAIGGGIGWLIATRLISST
jgi:hypothetical protein